MSINPENITTIRVGELPQGSISLTSKIAIENGTTLYRTDIQGLVDFLNINVGTRQFQIIELWVNQAYIDDNFDNTGFGINLCEGLAICNGQNGTPPMDGLVSVGFGTNYNVVGAFGGSKDAVVPSHSHKQKVSTGSGSQQGVTGDPTAGGSIITYVETETVGVSGNGKNMQPYIVLLKCMKL